MYKKLLGECIRNARNKLNMTQLKLADDIGVTVNTISNIERGSSYPSMEVLFKLNEILGYPLINFFISIKSYNEYIDVAELNTNLDKLSKEDKTFAIQTYKFIINKLLEKENNQ